MSLGARHDRASCARASSELVNAGAGVAEVLGVNLCYVSV